MKIKAYMQSYGVITSLLVILIVVSSMQLMHPDETFSTAENRSLEQRPVFSIPQFANQSFQKQTQRWLNDQFYGRTALVQMKTNLEYRLGKRRFHDVWIKEKGSLFQAAVIPSKDKLRSMSKDINTFAKDHKKIKVSMMLVPNKASIWKDKLPTGAYEPDQKQLLETFHHQLTSSITWIDTYDALLQHKEEPLYYHSDHHWTSLGAYTGFEAWRTTMHKKQKASYDKLCVNEHFYGSLAKASAYYRGKSDRLELWLPKKAQDYIVTYVNEKKKTTSVFDERKANAADPYEVFFGGNHSLVTMDTLHSGKNLLVIKDSYANSLVPFLLPYYKSITMVDPRYYYDALETLIKDRNIQEVLFLYNANTYFSDTSLHEILRK